MRIPLLGGIVAAAAVPLASLPAAAPGAAGGAAPLSTPGNGNERFKVVRVDFGS